jgi:predicted CXXCH cytochrome family protein
MFACVEEAIAKPRPVGAVVAWRGTVTIKHKWSKKPVTVKRTSPLYVGDVVTTAKGSKAKLLMKDDSVLSLGARARLDIDDYVFDRRRSKRVSVFNMVRGSVRALAGRYFSGLGSKFEIKTPTSVAGVKGTDFIVRQDQDNDTSEIITLRGKVLARSSDDSIRGEVMVLPGYSSKIRSGQAPGKPKKVSKVRLNALMDETNMPVTLPFDEEDDGYLKESASEQSCAKCHQPVYAAIRGSTSKHGAAVKDCAKCHIKNSLNERSKILIERSRENMLFLDLKRGMDYKLRVKVRDERGLEGISKELAFKASERLPLVSSKTREPEITGLRIAELKHGMFFSARIEWKTDEPSSSRVEFGRGKKFDNKSRISREHLVTEHSVTIDKLTEGKSYYLRAVSIDALGNKAVSEPMKLKASKPFNKDTPRVLAEPPKVSGLKVFRVGKRFAVKWSVNKAASTTVEYAEDITEEERLSKDPHSPGRNGFIETGYYKCLACHQGVVHRKLAHPTGKVGWKGYKTPQDLRLGVGDTLLCGTCHMPHGGVRGELLQKEHQELCTSCHYN